MLTLAAIDWSSLIVKAVASAIVTGTAGILWLRGSGVIADWVAQRRGEIRGQWFAVLPEIGDAPERIDAVRIRQRGQRLVGHIKRIRPPTRTGKWRMVGYVHGSVVVCVFHTKTPGNDPSSYGVICVHRVPGHGAQGVYCGYYTRPEFEPFDRFVDGSLATRPIIWQRTHPDAERYEP